MLLAGAIHKVNGVTEIDTLNMSFHMPYFDKFKFLKWTAAPQKVPFGTVDKVKNNFPDFFWSKAVGYSWNSV